MKTLSDISLALLAIVAALSSFDHAVEGMAWLSDDIECLEEAPEVCVVRGTFSTPVPMRVCDDSDPGCKSYAGSWGWSYTIVDGTTETEHKVDITIGDDEESCRVSIGGEACAACSAKGCGDLDWYGNGSVRYDCSNLENGRTSLGECAPLSEPFLYPLRLDKIIGEASSSLSGGSTWGSFGIECLEEAPHVCAVRAFYNSPTPTRICSDNRVGGCETMYEGGWSWSFSIAEYLKDGVNTNLDDALEEANLHVDVELNDYGDCKMSVAGQECTSCSIGGCDGPNGDFSASIKYDCTNLEHGRSSGGQCHPLLEPFLYPLRPERGQRRRLVSTPVAPDSDADVSFIEMLATLTSQHSLKEFFSVLGLIGSVLATLLLYVVLGVYRRRETRNNSGGRYETTARFTIEEVV